MDRLSPRPLTEFDQDELRALMRAWGHPEYRAGQIWKGLYQRRVEDSAGLTDLPGDLRRRLSESYPTRGLQVLRRSDSADGRTTKLLLGRAGDPGAIESVMMRYDRRRTGCLSTQVGCAMNCSFCATGQMGFLRNLSAGEIVEQVLWLGREAPLTNLVLMGMGEPFHNYEATMAAIDRLTDAEGMRFGARRITLSTVGLVPMILRFAREQRQVNLAVSLHAASDELRNRLVPINRRFPLDELMEACGEYLRLTRRRLTFEWALIDGVNDGLGQARALAGRIRGMLCHVNLIPLNPTPGYPASGSDSGKAEAFRDFLRGEGIPVTLRQRRGIDIAAGCGQLATQAGPVGSHSPEPSVR